MNRAAFEQLVSEWLDRPGRADLRARVEAALREKPALARVLERWRHLNQLLQAALPSLSGVDSQHFRMRVAQSLAGAAGQGRRQQHGR